ncbi:MAG TPA: MFS transporter [Verrucomicrobiae bacterium]|jgi:multidrug resistance protein|nr:MFS transporter [Verrucomicrobiae bacterium]
MRKPSVLIIFLTVFIDLIGFGIVIPLLPIYAKNFAATGLEIGALMSTFSLMQFVFAPVLGRLSDRIGRRPVILTSTAGACISYAIFAWGSGLPSRNGLLVLFLSRAFAGLCGGNIGVAQAYIADITPPEQRSKKMGLIGMAFGLGFILGPFFGAKARQYFGPAGPGWVASSFCAINFILATVILPESRKPGSEHVAPRPHLDQWLHTMQKPKVGLLISVFFLATFCFTCFETTLSLLVLQKFGVDPETTDGIKVAAHLFMFAGIVGAVFQGGATGRLVKLLGEPKLVAVSLLCVAFSLGPMPFANTWTQIYLLLALLAIGSSMTRPPVFGMISNLTSSNEQGATIGVAQSMGSLARILGPIFAATLFVKNPILPYASCAVVALITALLAWAQLPKNYHPTHAAKVETVPEA